MCLTGHKVKEIEIKFHNLKTQLYYLFLKQIPYLY